MEKRNERFNGKIDKRFDKKADKKASALLNFIFVLLIIGLLSWIGYYVYLNLPGEPVVLHTQIKEPELEIDNLSYAVEQFYPNMKFNHNDISYEIGEKCDARKRNRMKSAFDEIERKVDKIEFYESKGDVDIIVSCSNIEMPAEEGFFVAGEGGANKIIQTGRYNVIQDGTILLNENPHDFLECEWPNIELHELMHVFGFNHSQDEGSLMYPKLESCSQKLDASIINDLNKLYSEENLPDLYFDSVEAVRKGRYLDFNVTIKNSGTIDSERFNLSVVDEEVVKEFEMKEVNFGAGINFRVSNVKLSSRNPEKVKLVLDYDNKIKEISENNNVARLSI